MLHFDADPTPSSSRLCTELKDCQDSLAASLAHLKDREMWHANLMQSLEQCKVCNNHEYGHFSDLAYRLWVEPLTRR